MGYSASEFWLFLGRFHPVVVHLPIGFFILGILFDFLAGIKAFEGFRFTLRYIYFLTAVTMTLSIILGILLTGEGGYSDQTLSLHWLSGVLTCAGAWGLWHIHRRSIQVKRYLYLILLVLALFFLILTGDMGARLSHGENYLREHGPGWLKREQGNTPPGKEPGRVFMSRNLPV